MHNLLQIATTQLGVKEVPGASHNEQILKYSKEAGFSWINDDETPWCAIFVSWCAKKAGLAFSKQPSARSWLHQGMPVTTPEPGDVVVFWRESPTSAKGHVGIFLGYSKDSTRVYCLGGNQGNQVSITAMPASQVLSYRRLENSKIINLPEKTLKKGDAGIEVRKLQDALKIAGYEVGTSDGMYGSKTENAIMLLQSTKQGMAINGVFDSGTRIHLQNILNA
ncbi:MAG: TIGR02594 family protein [Cytophagales bacterium]|nr:TIGR02594 family protein [Cytophagales bacterium]